MTASTAITVNEIPSVAWLELEHRESVLADILAHACNYDREINAVERAVSERLGATWRDGAYGAYPQEALVQAPYAIDDALTGMHAAVARLSVALYPAAADLVDRALEFAAEWQFDDWDSEKQEPALRSMFERAGIAERFEPQPFLSTEADLSAEAEQP